MNASFRIDHHEIPSVPAREQEASLLKLAGELPSAAGAPPNVGDLLCHVLRADAGALGLQHFGVARGALGTWPSLALDMRALHSRVAEFALKRPRYQFMLTVIVAVADRAHAHKVDARPHNVAVDPVVLAVDHHDPRLAGKAECGL